MKSLSRGRKRIVGFGLFSLLLVGSVGLIYGRVTAPAPIQIPPYPALPSPNGFDVYVKAAQAIVPVNPAVDEINDRTRRTPQQAAVLYSAKRRRAWIDSNEAAWALMAKAKTLPSLSPNLRGATPNLPAWRQLRELARCQSIRVKDAKAAGKWEEAANLGLDTIEMAYNVERGSMLIGSLVSMAIESIGQRSLEDVPSRLNGVEAKAVARRLEGVLNKAQPFSRVLQEEKWTMVSTVNRMGTIAPTKSAGLWKTLLTPRTAVTRNYVTLADGFIDQADKPLGAQTIIAPSPSVLDKDVLSAIPIFKGALFNDARRKANARLLLLRLALRAHRVERGAYPKKLADLSPTYLQKVPVDAFGKGESFRYRTNGDSFVAWSIGPDGVDNNGISIRPSKGKKRPIAKLGSKGDVVALP